MFTIANQATLESFRVAFHLAFFERYGKPDDNDPLSKLFTTVPSTADLESWNWIGDLPDFEEWKGDRFLAGLSAFALEIRNKNWASGLKLHQNDLSDDKLGLIQPAINQLANKARRHRFKIGVRALLAGMGTGLYPGISNGLAYDGAFFFSASHATGSNKLTQALDAAGLAAAELLLNSQMSFDGKEELEISGTHLFVGPKLKDAALRLMGSEIVATAAGTAAESNHLRNRYEVVTLPQLRGTVDDWWFLADLSGPIRPMIFQLREEISTSAVLGQKGGTDDSVPRFKSGDIWFGAEARYNVAPFEFRSIVGSQVA